MGPISTCFFIKMIYLLIQKHCKLYGIVVIIMSPGNLLEIISAGLLNEQNTVFARSGPVYVIDFSLGLSQS